MKMVIHKETPLEELPDVSRLYYFAQDLPDKAELLQVTKVLDFEGPEKYMPYKAKLRDGTEAWADCLIEVKED